MYKWKKIMASLYVIKANSPVATHVASNFL